MQAPYSSTEQTNAGDTAWFEPWFGTEYYHLLYRHRNREEAEVLVRNLVRKLDLAPGSKVLDLPCGKGRHAVVLEECGMDVTAADLSEENILHGQRYASDRLRFVRHDMRSPLAIGYFNAVFNLFTSFGYFDRERENQRVVNAAADSLRRGGTFVLDFLNVKRALQHLVKEEELVIEGVGFRIQRLQENGKIVKRIQVHEAGTDHHFREEVRILYRPDLERLLKTAGFQIEAVLGDYELNPFDEENSPRIIFIARKA